uniref:Beta/alpha-defensin C-terminal domain-containing protein n=1 Tax=Equus asinus TaxID=9793 RepID=A0A8C4N6R1_EQUAS
WAAQHSVLVLETRGFTAGIGNPISCARNRGVCIPIGCLPGMKQIGTCGLPGTKCCRKNQKLLPLQNMQNLNHIKTLRKQRILPPGHCGCCVVFDQAG